MIKKCPGCNKQKDMRSNQKYCSKKCKKTFENSQRSAPKNKNNGSKPPSNNKPSPLINRPQGLNEIAASYWDKIAPTVMERGHLNILSEDAFAELCDLYSRLKDINKAIDETNRSLLQIDDKWDNKTGVETQSFKESALSDIKRKYSKLFLDYQKQFYLIPLSNRGNFGLDQGEQKDPEEEFLSMGSK
jgi:hypothetical protein